MNTDPVLDFLLRKEAGQMTMFEVLRAVREEGRQRRARMPDRPQVVKFTENYMDDETRISYYRGDEVVVQEGEFRRASALGAIEHLGSKDEYGQEVEQRKAAGVVMPVEAEASEASEAEEEQA